MTTNQIPDQQSAAENFTPGQTVAESLTLKQKLSTGDTGILWLAHDGDAGKDIALLFLPAALLSDARVLDDLRAQVKLNRQLIHPHVLRTHDFIEEDGWAAISCDAVDAETLSSLLAKKEKGFFEVSEIKPWVATVCQTLDDAHRANLLHRDLVPQNILLTKSGGILLANFGISRIILDALGRTKAPGEIDEHLGSMSPQQLDGELPARWDDVYALGILIYQLLTGKPPFHTGDLLPQIRKTVPASMTDRRAESGLAGEPIPQSWEKVVASCLEKHTPQRPKSAREVGVKLAADLPAVQTAVAPVARVAAEVVEKQEPKVSKPQQETKESLVEDIVWRKQHPQLAPGAAPTSLGHLLQRVPEETGAKKRFPMRKWAIIAGPCLGALIIVLMLSKNKPQQEQQTSNPTPTAKPAPVVAATPAPTPVAVTPAPKATPQIVNVEPAKTPSLLPSAVSPEKMRSLEDARKAVDETQKSVQEKAKLQEQADADAAAAKSDIDAKTTALAAMKKTADDTAGLRKQSEDAQAKADAEVAQAQKAVDDAQKAAAEKAHAADESRKVKEQLLAKIKDQEDAQQKAAVELQDLQTAAAEKQRLATEAAKARKDVEDRLQQQQQALKQAEAEALQPSPAPSPTPAVSSLPLPSGTSEALVPIATGTAPSSIEADEHQLVMNQLAKKQQDESNVTPAPQVPVTYVSNPKSQIDKTLTNSLGMKFQPVGDVLFGIWLVRVQDFDAFAKATKFKGTTWLQPGFKQGPDHPVVNVTWSDAMAFCKWLTDKEQKAGLLAPNQYYRLPTDLEWSKAVGLPDETGKTPQARDMDVEDVYPWGTQWPPPAGAGNYTGEETSSDVAIKGYDDGYGFTSPVGSFTVNKYGLYDMGGNAWQWCMDWWNGEQKAKVLRGASWYNGGLKLSLLSSCRLSSAPDITTDNFGFRCVIATDGKAKK